MHREAPLCTVVRDRYLNLSFILRNIMLVLEVIIAFTYANASFSIKKKGFQYLALLLNTINGYRETYF